MMLIATLTITAIPPFSAFFSKDAIMSALYARHMEIFVIAFVTSLLTAFYMFRILFVLFFSKNKQQPRPIKQSMMYPMTLLTVLSIFAGLLNVPEIFGGNMSASHWLNLSDYSFFVPHTQEMLLMSLNTFFTIGVIFYTYKKYAYTDAIELEKCDGLIANKFYIDVFYTKTVVWTLDKLSDLFEKKISQLWIDGAINSMGISYLRIATLFARAENGNVRFYALYMLIGVVSGFIYLYWSLRASL